ncbi:MAG TPA: UDP-N-acetylglucosamine 2-epimerase (non-hydrolyzing) [Rhodospirillales bacterium]|nr:UDP-N-acetylglucosamine 2-epimerase (non-hydrolyzing) [Rhodospirillales bacterium]
MGKRKIVTIVGARPQFIKAAAVTRALRDDPLIEEILVHSGQHFDPNMSATFFDELMIPAPRHHLGVSGGGHGRMTGRMMEQIEPVLADEKPDLVLIYGDTNTTLAAAATAAKRNIPVAHVEAGLRSFRRSQPEEINRRLADQVSSLLFCPTAAAVANLRREGITEGVHHTGDVMFDTSLYARGRAMERSPILEHLALEKGRFQVATVHRAENTDSKETLGAVLGYLKIQAREDAPLVFPVHPRTAQAAEHFGLDFNGLAACQPVGYLDMARLLSAAAAVFTDSGGLQKEAFFYRVPCVILRDETEWVELIEAGWSRLWRCEDFKPRRDIDEYGSGHAAEAIVRLTGGFLDSREEQQ